MKKSSINKSELIANELEFYKTALNQASVVAITDLDGIITYVNNAFCEQYGFKPEEILGKNHRIINSGYHPKSFFKEMWDTISSGKTWRGEVRNKTKNGDIIWVDATIIPFLDLTNKPYQYLAIRYDISEKLSAIRFREMFLAYMSHEIRTPLHGLLNFVNFLEKTSLDSTQKEYVDLMQNSAETLHRIVDDLLDFYKLETGSITFESIDFNINDVVNSVIRFYTHKAIDQKVEIEYVSDTNIPALIKGDAHRLKQVILNLVSNALKYTNKGKITISTGLVKNTGSHCEIWIKIEDTGKGIPKEKISSIFDKFTQVNESDARLQGGSGLGLNIVKQIIDLQKGSITVTSKYRKGSIFTIQLGFEISKPTIAALSKISFTKSMRTMKVLVADDIYANRILASKMLSKLGLQADFATNGQDAVSMARKSKYCIILMDIKMPVMDGLQATVEIRNSSGNYNKTVPVIALTANTDKEELKSLKKVGITDYLNKPFSLEDLYKKVSAYTCTELEKITSHDLKITDSEKCDLSYLLEISEGDRHFIREILEYFCTATPELLKVMRNDCQQKDFESLYNKSHAFIPQLTFVGLKSVIPIAEELEKHAKSNNDIHRIEHLLNKIEEMCNEAYPILKNYLKNLN